MNGTRGAWLVAVLLWGVGGVEPVAAQSGSPAGPVPPERLAARRAALAERIGTGVAVLWSAEPRDIEGDYPQDSDYREDNDFFYLTGLEAPGAWLVLVARDGRGEEILYLPARNPAAERWTGPQLGPGPEAASLSGIRDVRAADRAGSDVAALLSSGDSPARRGGVFIKANRRPPGCNGGESDGVCGLFAGLAGTSDLRPHLAALRLVKDEDELRRLRRAIGITTEAQRAAMAAAGPGMWEYELEALIEYTFRRRGAERVGFPSIVGSGPNSTVLHYDKSRRRMEAGDLVVVDIGAEYGYYSADVTRTYPVSGRFTPRQRALYELVLGAQEAAIRAVRPGVTIRELTQIARAYMRENSGDLCGGASCERYFVHGLSHWLGMDVHDVGDIGTPLAPGMVLTIEPGIYIPEESIGIRIEDDVLVTAEGAEVLSADAPRTPDEVERAMAAAAAAAGTR
jgi:Xaa-Pro aminopeptidase